MAQRDIAGNVSFDPMYGCRDLFQTTALRVYDASHTCRLTTSRVDQLNSHPKRTLAIISCCSSEAFFSPYPSARLSHYDVVS